MRYHRILLFGMVAGVAASAVPASAARYPISRDQVAAAVSRLGMQVAPDQVTMLANVSASTSVPTLTVRSIEPWIDHRLTARIECESSGQCLPFYVSLSVAPDAAAQAAAAVAQTNLPKSSTVSSRHFAVLSGTPATLMLDGGRVHIRLSVICLESGVLGQTIRVTDRDRKKVFRAEVVDGGLLKGSL